MSESSIDTISIRPGVSVLSVLSHLNYRAWYALAEFVDNSVQSYLAHKDELRALHGPDFRLDVSITVSSTEDGGRVTVRDNAAGIAYRDFPRAFRPAEIPPDRGGLSEFGMGMKSSACWFSPLWEVRTSALGEPTERRVRFDIARIVNDQIDEIAVENRSCEPESHFTEVILRQLHRKPHGATIARIKEHLSEIYRVFVRRGDLKLSFNGEELVYKDPDILIAPLFDENNEPSGPRVEWKKIIDFDFGDGLRATGFVAIRSTGSTSHAGFSLFRRDRLIEGSGDEKYRPLAIFGNPNSYAYQRLFGELFLTGFDVSHTKDGFQWDDKETPFLELLKEHIESDPKNLLRQARNYRTKRPIADVQKELRESTNSAVRALRLKGPTAIPIAVRVPPSEYVVERLPDADTIYEDAIKLDFEGRRWCVAIEYTDDLATSDWLEASDSKPVVEGDDDGDRETLGMRMNIAHPFVRHFASDNPDVMEVLIRLGVAIVVSEKLARDGGVAFAGTVRTKLNRILRDVFSHRDLSLVKPAQKDTRQL